jgi:hypothetical protein
VAEASNAAALPPVDLGANPDGPAPTLDPAAIARLDPEQREAATKNLIAHGFSERKTRALLSTENIKFEKPDATKVVGGDGISQSQALSALQYMHNLGAANGDTTMMFAARDKATELGLVLVDGKGEPVTFPTETPPVTYSLSYGDHARTVSQSELGAFDAEAKLAFSKLGVSEGAAQQLITSFLDTSVEWQDVDASDTAEIENRKAVLRSQIDKLSNAKEILENYNFAIAALEQANPQWYKDLADSGCHLSLSSVVALSRLGAELRYKRGK